MIRRRSGAWRIGLTSAVIALVAAACGGPAASSARPVADVGRSGEPAMALVSFTDVAAEVGLDFRHGAFRWGTSLDPAAMMSGGVCWIDYDADGWLDLFAVNTWSDGEWSRWQDAGGLPTSRLYRNDAGHFVDVTSETGTGLAVRGNGCVAADLDGDGLTDLYVTTERQNVLLWNDGGVGFVDGSADAGVAAYGWHSAATAADVDGDGRLDLFVAGYADTNRVNTDATAGFPNNLEPEPDLLFVNQGSGGAGRPRFVDVAEAAGVEAAGLDYGLGAVFSDVDGDGDADLYVANDTQPNRLYLNSPDRSELGFRLVEAGAAAGVDDDGAGMGVAAGDYDGDGHADLAVTNVAGQLHRVFRSQRTAGDPAATVAGFDDALAATGSAPLDSTLTGWGAVWSDIDLDTDLDLVIVHGAIPVEDLELDAQPVRLYENDTVGGLAGVLDDVSEDVGLDNSVRFLARGAAAADYDNDGDVDLAVATLGGNLALLQNRGAAGHWLRVVPEPSIPGTVVTVTLPDGTSMTRQVLAGSSYLSSEDPRVHVGLGGAEAASRVEVRWPDGSVVALSDVAADQAVTVSRRG